MGIIFHWSPNSFIGEAKVPADLQSIGEAKVPADLQSDGKQPTSIFLLRRQAANKQVFFLFILVFP